MIFNNITRHDIKQINSALKRIKDTMKTIDEDTCDREYVKWEINNNIDDIIFYANEMRKDIEGVKLNNKRD